jgi:phage shock protein A
MSGLFKKLNLLVKSSINDVLGDASTSNPRRRAFRRGKQIDQEITGLRQRINDAISHEEQLQAQIVARQAEIARLDSEADQAVKQGNDALARHLIGQMQRSEQRVRMMESELREHQLMASDLIQCVNLLDTKVAESKGAEQATAKDSDLDESAAVSRIKVIAEGIKNIHRRVEASPSLVEQPASISEASESEIEDDLAERRQRLSKPDK